MRASSDGWEIVADSRHAEVMVEQIGVKDGRGVLTLGVPNRSDEVSQVAQKVKGKCPDQLQGHDVTSLREVAARPITWDLRGQTSSTLQKNCVGKWPYNLPTHCADSRGCPSS